MSGWLGEAFSLLIALLMVVSIVIVVWVLFTLPSESVGGLPEAFQYFIGVFSRG